LAEGIQIRDPDKAYAEACYMIEKELHQKIDGEYPVAKFLAQVQLLNEDFKRQKKELEKTKTKRFR